MTDWEKRAQTLLAYAYSGPGGVPATSTVDQALQLGREMSDARAEEIAVECERRANCGPRADAPTIYQCAAAIARATIKESKTREQVLEEALRKMPCICHCTRKYGLSPDDGFHERHCPYDIARLALRG